MIRFCLISILVVFLSVFIQPNLLQKPESPDWFNFYLPWDDHTPSITDVSKSLHVPAGRYGFIQVGSDGHFHLENGDRIKFWGTTIGHHALFPPKEVATKIAGRLAKFGFNLVRIDGLDRYIFSEKTDDTQHFDSRKLDHFDYLVSQLKKHGIYISITITAHRIFRAGDQVIDWSAPNFHSSKDCIMYSNERLLRAMAIFDPTLNQLQRKYARELLTHKNPYTGNRYIEEPALAFLEIINETTLDHAWYTNQLNYSSHSSVKVTRYYSEELDILWNLWLLDKYGSREEVVKAWASPYKKGLLPDEDPSRSSVKRILYSERNQYSEARVLDLQRFYHQLQKDYFNEFYCFLKNKVGVKAPISGTHTFHGMPNQLIQAKLDFTGTHAYWEHPLLPPCKKWLQAKPKFLDTSMTNTESSPVPEIADWIETKNTLYKIAFGSKVRNKPLVISEYNHPYPNQYQAEFPLIISAYGSFQDWDGIIIHSYLETLEQLKTQMITNGFVTFNNPVLMAQMPVASLLFREGYIKKASKNFSVSYSKEEAFHLFLKCGIDIHCVIKEKGIDPHLSLVQGIRSELTSQPVSLPKIDELTNPYQSDTGQLEWNVKEGKVVIDTSRIQAAVGFLSGKPVKLSHLTIRSDTNFGAISLISLDGKPIAKSNKLLLTAVSKVRNKGMVLKPQSETELHQVKSHGKGPVLVEKVKGEVKLNHQRVNQLRVFQLSEMGNPYQQVPSVISKNEGLSFKIGNQKTLWYAIMTTDKKEL